MISMNYKSINDVSVVISKLCRDIAQHNNIREIYDILIKWIFLRMWGGVSSINNLI